ncbi:MAG TPA: hypothetical protein VGH99_20590 [Pseudonocardia sp.]|jgi:hypothetical protein
MVNTRWIDIIVGQTLDDLEAERIDVPAALRLVATLAWRDGHELGSVPPFDRQSSGNHGAASLAEDAP